MTDMDDAMARAVDIGENDVRFLLLYFFNFSGIFLNLEFVGTLTVEIIM